VLVFAVLGAVVIGVIPALQATGRRAQTGLQYAASGSRWKIGRTYGALIVVQVALAVAILPVAVATAWRTVQSATADPGFPADQFLVARLDIDRSATANRGAADVDAAIAARLRDRQAQLVQRLRVEPALVDIAALTGLPGNDPNTVIEVDGRAGVHQTGTARLGADFSEIDVDVLGPLGIDLIGGRMFEPLDLAATSPPVLVNATFARRIAGGNPVGLRIRERSESGTRGPWREVVGVISDFPRPADAATADARMYFPVARGQAPTVLLALQLRGTPAAFANRLREIAASVDRNLQVSSVTPMPEVLERMDTELRVFATVSGLITISVLLLSATGLYALMAFTVAARRREIGLRQALGCTRLRLVATMMKRSFGQLAIGIAIGTLVARHLFGEGEITGENGWIMLPLVVAGVLLVGLAAAGTPALRALRVQPTEALRDE
jgi:putative ABC transport system permease protein